MKDKKVTIQILDPIHSQITDPNLVKNLLSFEKEFWLKNRFAKKKKNYTSYMIDKKGCFFTGFIPRICKFLESNNVDYEIDDIDWGIESKPPFLKNLTFRDDQTRQIFSAIEKQRGVIIAPTGAGKTVLMAGIISAFERKKILFLCHTIDLVDQALMEFTKFGFNCSKMGGGIKNMNGDIVVSTIQTFHKLNFTEYHDKFDVVLCDECHHSGIINSSYYKVLSNILAPIRFAFTATLPTKQEVKLCLEGLIGPVVDELSFKEATDIGILAIPNVRLIPVEPFSDYEVRTYADIYDKAIVNNKSRNRLILKEIKSLNREGLSTLTYVQKIEHIENLLEIAEEMKVKLFDVQGSIKGEVRLDIKKKLEEKEIHNVVSTIVWREGINIKSLNAIVIAGGGKNEKDLIQACGRGARKDDGKDEFVIVDFIDSAKYLSQHFCERLKIYIKKEWL